LRPSWLTRLSGIGQSLRRQLQKLRDRFQIPVRVMDMHVAEIRREYRQKWNDRAVATIAVDERADREAMTQIVEPRIAASQPMGTKPRSHADLGRHARKRVLRSVLRDAYAALGDKERIIETLPDDPISDGLLRRQRLHR
jgi:hypothetical protein